VPARDSGQAHRRREVRRAAPDRTRDGSPTRFALISVALALLTLAVYWPVRQFPFVNWDDPVYVSENAHVLAGLTRASVTWALSAFVAGNWHPLTLLSHMLDAQLFGTDAGWHHVTSLALHVPMAEAHSGLGAALALTGHDDQAIAEYQKALAIAPGLASAHVNLAAVLVRQGKIDEAIDQLTQALAADARQPAWHVELAARSGK
jgi:tetratricopeptide (TPR) repeat protein